MTCVDLSDAGYRYYKQNDEYNTGLYQMTVRAQDNIILYFITINVWEFPGRPTQFELDLCLYDNDGHFRVKRDITSLTVKHTEGWCGTTYAKMGCVPDQDNNY